MATPNLTPTNVNPNLISTKTNSTLIALILTLFPDIYLGDLSSSLSLDFFEW